MILYNRRPIAPQYGLTNAVEIDDSCRHGIPLLCAVRDRFTDQLVSIVGDLK